jgi:hypothetical protein
MVATMVKLATSPVAADSALASSSTSINGLAKRRVNRSQAADRLGAVASLLP